MFISLGRQEIAQTNLRGQTHAMVVIETLLLFSPLDSFATLLPLIITALWPVAPGIKFLVIGLGPRRASRMEHSSLGQR